MTVLYYCKPYEIVNLNLQKSMAQVGAIRSVEKMSAAASGKEPFTWVVTEWDRRRQLDSAHLVQKAQTLLSLQKIQLYENSFFKATTVFCTIQGWCSLHLP